jgi:hypothetical protein
MFTSFHKIFVVTVYRLFKAGRCQSVDIFSGELHLSAVALRPRVVARRLRVSGRAGQVVASWSWRRLLTEALQVEVNDLKIQLVTRFVLMQVIQVIQVAKVFTHRPIIIVDSWAIWTI